MIHPLASVHPETTIGPSTNVWQFTVILKGAVIGDHGNISGQVGIEGDVIIGDHVTIKGFTGIGDGTRIGNHVFIGPHVACINDMNPRSKQHLSSYPRTTLEDWCSIGAGSVIHPGIRVGLYSMVGAGSVVTKDVPDHALVAGNPARRIGWVDDRGIPLEEKEDGLWVGQKGETYCLTTRGLVRS